MKERPTVSNCVSEIITNCFQCPSVHQSRRGLDGIIKKKINRRVQRESYFIKQTIVIIMRLSLLIRWWMVWRPLLRHKAGVSIFFPVSSHRPIGANRSRTSREKKNRFCFRFAAFFDLLPYQHPYINLIARIRLLWSHNDGRMFILHFFVVLTGEDRGADRRLN